MNRIKLTVGDWSLDGHNMSEDFIIDCSITKEELQAAYATGSEIVGFDIAEQCCERYEDSTIPRGFNESLQRHGITELFESCENEIHADVDSFFLTWIRIAQLGVKFEYTVINDNIPFIPIGGYGLFSQ